jgi:hypothetical protein
MLTRNMPTHGAPKTSCRIMARYAANPSGRKWNICMLYGRRLYSKRALPDSERGNFLVLSHKALTHCSHQTVNMSTAHRPTWDPAQAKDVKGGSRQFSVRDMAAHTKLKFRYANFRIPLWLSELKWTTLLQSTRPDFISRSEEERPSC